MLLKTLDEFPRKDNIETHEGIDEDCYNQMLGHNTVLDKAGNLDLRLDVGKVTKLLDEKFCQEYPKTAYTVICIKWNLLPNVMKQLAQSLAEAFDQGKLTEVRK